MKREFVAIPNSKVKSIKASISVSTPDWLYKWLTGTNGRVLVDKYKVRLDNVEFVDEEPSGRFLPIYKINYDNWNIIYIPGVNDDYEIQINGRWRKLKSIAKSKLPEISEDILYIDLDNPNNTFAAKERYRDPRYQYRYTDKGKYAGQYKRQIYNPETRGYDEGEWSTMGMTPSNESRARDKSGYKVPSPDEMINRFYTKFPEKITEKVDSVYGQIKDVQAELMNADFNNSARYSTKYRNAYARFGDAVDTYRGLLREMDLLNKDNTAEKVRSWEFGSALKSISSIKSDLKDVIKYLDERE